MSGYWLTGSCPFHGNGGMKGGYPVSSEQCRITMKGVNRIGSVQVHNFLFGMVHGILSIHWNNWITKECKKHIFQSQQMVENNGTVLNTFLNISLPSKNTNISALVLALMLLRFGMTCLLTFNLLQHWCLSGACSRHIFLEMPILLTNLHIPVVLCGTDPAISLIHGFG